MELKTASAMMERAELPVQSTNIRSGSKRTGSAESGVAACMAIGMLEPR
jgi:hypothetical protein